MLKLLIIVSSLDLTRPFSATPAWWQLMKALYEIGVEVIAAPYQGPAIESLWWRAESNPAKWQGDLFKSLRDSSRRLLPKSSGGERPAGGETLADKVIRRTAQSLIAPLWWRHIDQILTRQPDIDAVIFLTTPLNHHVGLAGRIQEKHQKPVFYFDGDVPASLPDYLGFASGFRIYHGADLSEYTAFISNSSSGEAILRQMGARQTYTLWYGADPDVFSPVKVAKQDIDILFYGHGREYRSEWIDWMIGAPSMILEKTRFAVRGTQLGDLGRAESLPYMSFSKLREYACRSRINLVITRRAHAGLFGSSSSRPFELAAMQSCMVANPYEGIESWFEPQREIFIVHSQEEAVEKYRYLLKNEAYRLETARLARERVLKSHTFQHRAHELVEIIRRHR